MCIMIKKTAKSPRVVTAQFDFLPNLMPSVAMPLYFFYRADDTVADFWIISHSYPLPFFGLGDEFRWNFPEADNIPDPLRNIPLIQALDRA